MGIVSRRRTEGKGFVAAVEGSPNASAMGQAKEGGDRTAGSARPEASGTDRSRPPRAAGCGNYCHAEL